MTKQNNPPEAQITDWKRLYRETDVRLTEVMRENELQNRINKDSQERLLTHATLIGLVTRLEREANG